MTRSLPDDGTPGHGPDPGSDRKSRWYHQRLRLYGAEYRTLPNATRSKRLLTAATATT